MPGQAKGGSEIPVLVLVRDLKRVGLIGFLQSAQLTLFVCLSSCTLLSLLTIDFVSFKYVRSFSLAFELYFVLFLAEPRISYIVLDNL